MMIFSLIMLVVWLIYAVMLVVRYRRRVRWNRMAREFTAAETKIYLHGMFRRDVQ